MTIYNRGTRPMFLLILLWISVWIQPADPQPYVATILEDFDAVDNSPQVRIVDGLMLRSTAGQITVSASVSEAHPAPELPSVTGRYIRLQRTDKMNEFINIAEMEVYDEFGAKIPAADIVPSLWPPFDVKFAADKLTNGNPNDYAHTEANMNAYMQLDLKRNRRISKVDVINRLDCCQERTVGTSLRIRNTTNAVVFEQLIADEHNNYSFLMGGAASIRIPVLAGRQLELIRYPEFSNKILAVTASHSSYRAKYIRVERTDNAYEAIHLTEIEVYDENGIRIPGSEMDATLGPPYEDGTQHPADRLIDGFVDTEYDMAHTDFTPDAFVQLDLRQDRWISRVVIYNRYGGWTERLIGCSLRLKRSDGLLLYSYPIITDQEMYNYQFGDLSFVEVRRNTNVNEFLPVLYTLPLKTDSRLEVDYAHRLVYVVTRLTLFRFNVTDPTQITLLSQTSWTTIVGMPFEPQCCDTSSVELFDGRLAVLDTFGATAVTLIDVTSLTPKLLRRYTNLPSDATFSALWKHPTQDLLYVFRAQPVPNESILILNLESAETSWHVSLPSSPTFVGTLGGNVIGIGFSGLNSVGFLDVSNPSTPSVEVTALSYDSRQVLVNQQHLLTPKAFYSVTDAAADEIPAWMSLGTGEEQYQALNTLQVVSPLTVGLNANQTTLVLTNVHLSVAYASGRPLAFAPIHYIVTLQSAGTVQVWNQAVNPWKTLSTGSSFSQQSLDAGRVRIQYSQNVRVELVPTDWQGGRGSTVSFLVFATSTSGITKSTAGFGINNAMNTLVSSVNTAIPLGVATETPSSLTPQTGTPSSPPTPTPAGSNNRDSFLELLQSSMLLQIVLGCAGVLVIVGVWFGGVLMYRQHRRTKVLQDDTRDGPVVASNLALPVSQMQQGGIAGMHQQMTAFSSMRQPYRPAYDSFGQAILPGYAGHLGNVYAQHAQEILSSMGRNNTANTMLGRTLTQGTMVSETNYISFPAFASYENGEAFRMLRKIGGGGMATVWICDVLDPGLRERARNAVIVAKVSRDNTNSLSNGASHSHTSEKEDRILQAWRQEVSIGFFLQKHRNIMKTIGYSQSPRAILLKYYDLGSLDDLIHTPTAHISDFEWTNRIRLDLLLDCCRGLEYMHQNMVAHCDMKPDNVLLTKDPYTFKLYGVLSDFGVAQILSKTHAVSAFQTHHMNALSMRYAGPEVIERFRSRMDTSTPDIVLKGDIYAVAISMLEVITLHKSWTP